MKKHMYCPTCEMKKEIEILKEKEIYPVKNEPTEVVAEVTYCTHCREQIWNEEVDTKNLEKAYRKYRDTNGLLQPEDIKKIRQKYNLTQTSFAKILGVGEKTITRYENGSIQDLAQNNLIALSDYVDVFKLLLDKNKTFISDSDYEKAFKAIEGYKVEVLEGDKSFPYQTKQSQYKICYDQLYFGGVQNGRIG